MIAEPPSLTKEELSAINAEYQRICPGFRYLDNPRKETKWLREALDAIYAKTKLRPVGKPLGFLSWEVEKRIVVSKQWKVSEGWCEEWHLVRLACLLFPSLAPDPFFQLKVWAACYTQKQGKKFCNFYGCANSGKTLASAIHSLMQLVINPSSKVLITGSWARARDETIWRQLTNSVRELISTWGRTVAPHWQISVKESECEISFGGSGTIVCRSCEKTGKLQGTKQDRGDDPWSPYEMNKPQKDSAAMHIILEEISVFPNTAILRDFNNLVSNSKFLALSNCNPENTVSGLDAELGAPLNREFASLSSEEDYHWATRRGGFVFRFDGLRSPAMLGWGKLCHRDLFNSETERAIAEASGGRESDGYFAMVRAFPRGTFGGRLVTDETRQMAAGVFDPFVWSPAPKTHVLYLDAAFGGNDPATYVLLCCGDRRDAAGVVINTIEGVEIGVLPINSALIATAEMVKELKSFGWPDVEEGKHIIPGLQCAWQLRKKMEEWRKAGIDIISRFVGCDQSMRGDQLSLPMRTIIGPDIMMLDPTEKPAHDKPVLPMRKSAQPRAAGQPTTMYWNEFCAKKVTEIWLVAAYIVHSGAVRGGVKINAGLKAMGTRYIKKSQSRTDVMGKDDWKESAKTWFDAADALCGALFLAYSRGLVKYTHTPENMKPAANTRTLTITPELKRASEWRQTRENAHLIY